MILFLLRNFPASNSIEGHVHRGNEVNLLNSETAWIEHTGIAIPPEMLSYLFCIFLFLEVKIPKLLGIGPYKRSFDWLYTTHQKWFALKNDFAILHLNLWMRFNLEFIPVYPGIDNSFILSRWLPSFPPSLQNNNSLFPHST